jgi:serine/threonine protein kinase
MYSIMALFYSFFSEQIALKVIPKKEIKNERIRQRLMREIKIMQELKHDNIVDYIERKLKIYILLAIFA